MVELRERAKAEGLWNLFLPDEEHGPGLTNWEYGMLCEDMGRRASSRRWSSTARRRTRATWRSWPSTARPSRSERWLEPLLNDHVRSCFSMTEPETAGSDPTGPRRARGARRRRVGDQRAQVVHVGLQRGLGRDRHGGHRPRRRAAPAREHDPRADRHAGLHRRPAGAGDGPRRGPGHWEVTLRGRARARGRTCSARAARASRSPRPASGPAASTTACARSARPSARSS